MEQCFGPLALEMVPGKHCDFSTYLASRARAKSGACAEVQFPDYGIVLWSPGSRKFSRKSLRFQHLFCQERELSLAHALMCSFLIMEQSCSPLAVEIVLGKHCIFSTYLAKRAIVQSGACAEEQIPDYGRDLWSSGSRICSRKVLRFQHLSCQENESSVWSMRRGEFS
jgi:hypothetical protein